MNPYEVLGVSPSASNEEIREAYLKLVKKYHPDRYQDSDLKEQAEEKMKKINAAYDMLTKQKKDPGASYSQGSYGGQSYGGYGQSYGGQSYGGAQYRGDHAQEFQAVRRMINGGDVAGAMRLLNSIPVRNAEWNFLYGMCFYRAGQYTRAYEYVSRACSMDPNNAEYAQALNNMRGGSETRTSWTANGRTAAGCMGLAAASLLISCMSRCCCY
ncbi:MAG: J domain-containing protein [Clostridiales bacterium]|nr:J domain-containing protein [Clostridiales bacterium]